MSQKPTTRMPIRRGNVNQPGILNWRADVFDKATMSSPLA